jgi:hypothetical protein
VNRHPVQPRSSIQAGAESVAAPLVYADARNVEVLTDLQPLNAGRDLAVLARLLDAWTDVGVPQCDAVFVAASGIDNLPRRDGTVRVDPVAPWELGANMPCLSLVLYGFEALSVTPFFSSIIRNIRPYSMTTFRSNRANSCSEINECTPSSLSNV